MDYRVEKEVLDDGHRLLSMFNEEDAPVCYFCTEPKPLGGLTITYDCTVYLCKECLADAAE